MSIYKDYQREPSRQRQCMQHSEKDGIRCRATAMHNEIMCFQHRSDDIPTVLQNDPFEIAHLDDRAAIQLALFEVLSRLSGGDIDYKRGGILLYGLQIASSNLPRYGQPKAEHPSTPQETTPHSHQESLPLQGPETCLRDDQHQKRETTYQVSRILAIPRQSSAAPPRKEGHDAEPHR